MHIERVDFHFTPPDLHGKCKIVPHIPATTRGPWAPIGSPVTPKVRSTPTNSLVRKLNSWLSLIMTADRGKSRNRRELVALLFALCFAAGTALAAPAADATDQFYDPEAVQTIHLEIKAEDLDRLHRALPQRIYVAFTGIQPMVVGLIYRRTWTSGSPKTPSAECRYWMAGMQPGLSLDTLTVFAMPCSLPRGVPVALPAR